MILWILSSPGDQWTFNASVNQITLTLIWTILWIWKGSTTSPGISWSQVFVWLRYVYVYIYRYICTYVYWCWGCLSVRHFNQVCSRSLQHQHTPGRSLCHTLSWWIWSQRAGVPHEIPMVRKLRCCPELQSGCKNKAIVPQRGKPNVIQIMCIYILLNIWYFEGVCVLCRSSKS